MLVGAEGEDDEGDLEPLQQHRFEGDREGVAVEAPSAAAAARRASARKIASSSCLSLAPAARRIALRSHCRPKVRSRPPTTTRRTPSGSEVSAGPSAPTSAGEDQHRRPDPGQRRRQRRVVPTARTIVNASTASTAQARKTESARLSSARSPQKAKIRVQTIPATRQ